jgi:DNA-binding FadR family transcriptional regulator
MNRASVAEFHTAVAEVLARDESLARRLNAAEALIVRETGNPVLSLLVASLADVGVQLLRSGRATLEPALTAEDNEEHLDEYRRLVDAIAERDADGAGATAGRLTDFVLARVIDYGLAGSIRTVAPSLKAKRAEGLARVLQDDIERSGWRVGEVLGSEKDLVERYDVSRSILREAVRILEHHGAVRTKRGPRGGLIVAAPDGVALVRSARIVLEYERVSADNLLEARELVETVTARLAATRRSDADIVRLEAALAAETDGGDAAVSFAALHEEIANATQNRVLALFANVVDSLVPAHVSSESRRAANIADISREANRAHQRIVEAIVAGDEALAERRMLRHLRASRAVLA